MILLGRRVGAVTQLPHDGPVVVTGIEGEHRGALQFRREIETEVDNGDAMVPSESPGRTDLSFVSDVAHVGSVTALCSSAVVSHRSFLVSGNDRGRVSAYAVGLASDGGLAVEQFASADNATKASQSSPVVSVALNHDVVAALSECGSLRVMDLRADLATLEVKALETNVDCVAAYDMCWQASTRGCIFTVGALPDEQLKLWDRRLPTHQRPVQCIGNPDSSAPYTSVSANPSDPTKVAVGSADGVVAVCDLRTQQILDQTRLHQHSGSVRTLMYHPKDPRFLVSGGEDGRLLLANMSAISAASASGMGMGMGMMVEAGGGPAGGSGPTVEELHVERMGVVDVCFDTEYNSLVSAFSNECVCVLNGHPSLTAGSHF